MATATHTINRPFVRPARNYDYLYDPVFTVSSHKDHTKEAYKAQTTSDKLYRSPNYPMMFSSLPHYPRLSLKLDMTDPIPKHMPRHWQGYKDQARETLVRYTKFNYDPSVTVPPKYFPPVDADGRDRYKFFRRPIIPFLPQMPPSIVLAPQTIDAIADRKKSLEMSLAPPLTKTVYVQTDYRDSETQTDPYSPEFVIRPGSQPEILTIASMCYGHGLPAGLTEVEIIERARAKRAWEATLPPIDDMTQLEKRRRMMEEQECLEWNYREKEIQAIQEERMSLLRKLLEKREVDFQGRNETRLEALWRKKSKEKERKIRRVKNEHIKALRRLTEQRKYVEKKYQKRDIIHEYTNFDSQVYAPMTRIGVYLDAGSEQYDVKTQYNTTLHGLLDLEAALPPKVTNLRIKPPDPSAKQIGFKARQKAKLGNILDKVYNDLQEQKEKIDGDKPLRLLVKVDKPIPRPPTPTVDIPNEDDEKKDLSVILLQRVIRGRAIQNKMYVGKDMRSDLIKELRTTHALQTPEQKEKKRETEEIQAKQRAKAADEHKESVINDGTEQGAAELIGQQLDFLNKELLRLQEERRIHAYVMLAERQRRMREAEESGLRQREERLRRTQDEIFKQIIRVHQGSVDTYLEDVILSSIEKTADLQAREEIQKKANDINRIAAEFEKTRDQLQSHEMVAEMVYYFLLPEVEKQTIREKVKHTQRKHMLAAHRIIHKELSSAPIANAPAIDRKGSKPQSITDHASAIPSTDHTSASPSTDHTSTDPIDEQPSTDATDPITDHTSADPSTDHTTTDPNIDQPSSYPSIDQPSTESTTDSK